MASVLMSALSACSTESTVDLFYEVHSLAMFGLLLTVPASHDPRAPGTVVFMFLCLMAFSEHLLDGVTRALMEISSFPAGLSVGTRKPLAGECLLYNFCIETWSSFTF